RPPPRIDRARAVAGHLLLRVRRASRPNGLRQRPRVIEVEGLSKTFGPTLAVDDLTFSVEPGKITGFLGPNGGAKSTTSGAILGLVRPTSGTTTVLGKQYSEL